MFSTSRCANCPPVKASLKTLQEKYPELNVSYTVVDQEVEGLVKAQEWGIVGVPTLIFITDATERMRQVGGLPMSELEEYVKGFVEKDNGSQEDTCGI